MLPKNERVKMSFFPFSFRMMTMVIMMMMMTIMMVWQLGSIYNSLERRQLSHRWVHQVKLSCRHHHHRHYLMIISSSSSSLPSPSSHEDHNHDQWYLSITFYQTLQSHSPIALQRLSQKVRQESKISPQLNFQIHQDCTLGRIKKQLLLETLYNLIDSTKFFHRRRSRD